MRSVIFDTGPLVAWLCPRDSHHPWVSQAFAGIHSPGIVCEAVLAEVCHLVGKEGIPRGKVMDFVIDGGLRVVSVSGEAPLVRDLLNRYAGYPHGLRRCLCHPPVGIAPWIPGLHHGHRFSRLSKESHRSDPSHCSFWRHSMSVGG